MEKVEYSRAGRVSVTCRDGRVEDGTHVVSTLPLSVLQDGASVQSRVQSNFQKIEDIPPIAAFSQSVVL